MLTTKEIKDLSKRCFPSYAGRKYKHESATTYRMADYWDGGSREYCMAVNLATGEVGAPAGIVHAPFHDAAHAVFQIPVGVAIVTHSFFCGKDCGIVVYTRQESIALASAAPALAGSR